MKTLLAFLLVCAAAGASAQEATRGGNIVPGARRIQLLEQAEAVLARSPGDFVARAVATDDPFHEPESVVAPTDPLALLTDAQILQRAVAQLPVNGILGSGTRRSVQLGRDLYRPGAEIDVNLSGRSVKLRILEIRTRSVLFGYNAETLEVPIR